ncbi:hypothetical protein E1288_32695 [Saccharopolyspora elongata]|uniref:Uncharacterized protein n=1 Tax=Saccharopolyspora elongata TaxID=2530387 RepID=A0A4R4YAA0_9PSEU|nr:hypothetical protein E1288_32695 [Saccharopolyspora elongata]
MLSFDAGHPVKVCCRVLGVSSPGYYHPVTTSTQFRVMSMTKMICTAAALRRRALRRRDRGRTCVRCTGPSPVGYR